MNIDDIIQQYNEGKRDFQKFNLCGFTFKNQNLSGANFSNAKLNRTSFLNCNLDSAKFINVETGQSIFIKIIILLIAIITAYFAGVFTVYASASNRSISIIVFILFSILFICFFVKPAFQKISNSLLLLLGLLSFLFILFGGLNLNSVNDSLSFLFSFILLVFSVFFGTMSCCCLRVISFWLKIFFFRDEEKNNIFKGIFLSGFFTSGSVLWTIFTAPNKIGIEINIFYLFVNIIASASLIFLFYNPTIKVLLSKLFSLENTSFKGSSLINADFSLTWLAGVDFKGANLSGVCWFNAKDIDLAIMGHIEINQDEPIVYKESTKVVNHNTFNFSGSINGPVNAGGTVETQKYEQHNYMRQDLAQAASQIQSLLEQLQHQGITVDVAQEQVAKDIVNQAKNDPQIKEALIKWGQSLGNATITDVVKGVVKLAIRSAGIPLP